MKITDSVLRYRPILTMFIKNIDMVELTLIRLKRGEAEMNKKTFWRIIGGIFLFIALLLGVFAKEPFINLVVNNNELALSGSFSLLFLVMGIISLGYSIFIKRE